MSDDFRCDKHYELVNPVLRSIMRQVYEARKCFDIKYYANSRFERVNDKCFCQLFFMSKGCSHDAKGGCTMCNYGYGKAYEIDEQVVLAEVRDQISQLPNDLQEIVLTPIGSLLDDEEVPPGFRENLFEVLSALKYHEFTCETRVDSITPEKLRALKRQIHTSVITLEIGVETLNRWTLRNCVNKNSSPEQIQDAIKIAHDEGIHICANVGLGIPFLSERCNVLQAVDTVAKLLAMDVECVVLFPYNIRPGTLLEVLQKNQLYKCMSLWTIPEVLSKFSSVDLSRIQISWYRNYYQDTSKILYMPDTCPKCRESVLDLFDQYRNRPCDKTLEPLKNYNCDCRRSWCRDFETQDSRINFAQVMASYQKMTKFFTIAPDLLEREFRYMKQSLRQEV